MSQSESNDLDNIFFPPHHCVLCGYDEGVIGFFCRHCAEIVKEESNPAIIIADLKNGEVGYVRPEGLFYDEYGFLHISKNLPISKVRDGIYSARLRRSRGGKLRVDASTIDEADIPTGYPQSTDWQEFSVVILEDEYGNPL